MSGRKRSRGLELTADIFLQPAMRGIYAGLLLEVYLSFQRL